MTSQNRLRFLLIIVLICLLPLFLNLLGVDFASSHAALSAENINDKDILFKALAGSLHHVLLEWSAVCIAITAALTSLLHYKIKRDLTIPILGMALLCAGFVDAFHTLAATRIIEASADNTDFIPFTWALSRIFNASIMLIGTSLSLWLTYQYFPKHKIKHPINLLIAIGCGFILTAYLTVHIVANSTQLPQTMYTGALIARPFDVLPLGLFIVGGALFWLWFNIEKSAIKYALILSIVPEIATQLYMIFGSTALFDNNFNIAHALKIVAYCTILIGIISDLTATNEVQKTTRIEPSRTKKDELKNAIEVGNVSTPLTLKLPLVTFIISLLLTSVISYSFFIETNKIIKQAETQELIDSTELLKPMLGQFNQRLVNEIKYLAERPAISTYIKNKNSSAVQVIEALQNSLKRNFNYDKIALTSFSRAKKETISISKKQASIYDLPHFTQSTQPIYSTIDKTQAENILLQLKHQDIVFPEISINHTQHNEARLTIIATVRDNAADSAIGYLTISLNFNALFKQEIASNLPLLQLYLADQVGNLVVSPATSADDNNVKNTQSLTELAPGISYLQQNGKLQGVVDITLNNQTLPALYRQINLATYGYPHPLQLLAYLPHSNASELLANTRTNSFILGGFLALLSLAISIVMARQVTKPLEEITGAVQENDLQIALTQLPVSIKGELGVLARSFYNLILQIDTSLKTQQTTIEESNVISSKLTSIINTAADSILTLNRHDLIISANPASERIFGLSTQELLNLPINFILPEGINNLDELKADNEKSYFITQGKRNLTTLFSVEVSVSINPNDKTKTLIIRDISKQVKQEQELADARKYVDKITSSVPIMLAYVDSDLTYRFVNLNFERWYQKPLDTFINKNIFTALNDNAHAHMEHYIDSVLAGKTISFEDTQLCRGLGGKRHLRTTYTPDFNHGKVQGFYISIEDISELKHTAKQLELTSSRLEIALSAPEIGVWEYYIPDNKLLWDDRMYLLFGTRAASYKNAYEAWYSAIHPDDKDMIMGVMKHSIKTGDDINTEFKVRWPTTGDVRIIEAHAKVLCNNKGEPERLIGTNMDVTEHKNLITEKENALIRAEETTKLKSEFLASMSHEIRTPMNGVLGMLNLLQQSQLDSEQLHFTNLAKSSAESLLIIINDILDFSKIEAGKLDFESIDFSLHQLLSEFVESIATRTEDKQLELILDLTQVDNVPVIGDPGRLRQILMNLVGNAIKFTKEGEIVIRGYLTAENDNLTFTCDITDTGVGIPKEKKEHIFDSFTQVDASTTRQFGGTGLGLAIVQQLCHLMQGSIKVESEINKGSTFTFSIQLKPSISKEIALPQVDLTHSNIMIVDDNKTNLEVLSKQLNIWGAKTLTVQDPLETLNMLAQAEQQQPIPINVIILDMQMPSINGAELGKKIRQIPEYDHIKLIMMTSMGQRGDANELADIGFSAYFPKPTTNQDLYAALSIVIEDGDALHQATPLVTQHYVKTMAKPDKPHTEVHNSDKQNTWPSHTRLLLVEDNFVNQTVAQAQLKNIGLVCDIASNGKEALATLSASEQPYTIILMDCQMPEMDGYEATRKIRNGICGKHYTNVPIIALTANAMKGDKEKCLAAGMDDYLTKPLQEPLLKSMLTQWIV